MPTLINAVAGNADAWETSHSINIDVGAAAAGRRIVGFLSRFTDATERITAASQITLGGSSTGVTLYGTSTSPVGQAGSFYARAFDIAVPAGLSGTQALVVTSGDATARRTGFVAACYSDGGVPTFTYGSNAFNNNPTATIASASGEEVGLFVISISAGQSLTPGTGSSAITGAAGGTGMSFFGLRENGAASVTIDGTFPGSDEYCCVAWTLPSAGPAAEQEQEGARWGNDDGSESAHTFAAAQDANITAALAATLLLRQLVNGTGDPASSAYVLRYQKNGAGGYVPVPVGASVPESYGTVTFGAIGTGANGGTTVAPSYPAGITAGQYLTCHVSSGATNSETPSTPSGWTLLATGASTDGTYGVDTGPRRMTVFGKVADGTESGTLTVSITNGGTCRGTIARWTKSGSGAWVVDAQGGNDSTSGTGFSATLGSMNWNTGDAVLVAVGQRVDTVTQSAQSLTASGVTFGTRTNRESTAVTTGNDHRHVVDTFAAVSGTSNVNAAPTWAYTGSAATSGGVVIVRLREYTAAVTNEVYIAASSNIAAGGEATTARLTAPSGKSTSDFVTGRRWDDENGSDSIDITADDYTELEWSITTQAPAANGDYFDFRVYAGAAALTTYTVTPRLTIGTPAGALPPGLFRSHAARLAPLLNRR